MSILLIIIVLFLVFGGAGYWGPQPRVLWQRRFRIIGVILVVLVVFAIFGQGRFY